MFENRIQGFFSLPARTPAASAVAGQFAAFVVCPAPLCASFTPTHQAFVAEVYRRAQELTESQLRKPSQRAIPEFSLN